MTTGIQIGNIAEIRAGIIVNSFPLRLRPYRNTGEIVSELVGLGKEVSDSARGLFSGAGLEILQEEIQDLYAIVSGQMLGAKGLINREDFYSLASKFGLGQCHFQAGPKLLKIREELRPLRVDDVLIGTEVLKVSGNPFAQPLLFEIRNGKMLAVDSATALYRSEREWLLKVITA